MQRQQLKALAVTRCNFSCNLKCNSTLGKCKIIEYKFPSQFANYIFNIPNICHKFTTALQVARKIAPCDRAVIYLEYLGTANAATTS